MSQQTENDLWELLQEKPTEEPAKTVPAPQSKKDTSGKRSPWMFVSCGLGVALIATVAMLITGGGKSPSSPVNPGNAEHAAQVQELQAQVDNLTDERTGLLEQVEDLNAEIASQNAKMEELLKLYNEMSSNLEYVESNAALGNAENAEKVQRTMEAYQTLIKAQNAFLRYDEETLNDCIDQLMNKLELLDQDALNAFYHVMEYMEQPYWKNHG